MIAPKILGDALDLPLPVIIVGVFVGAAAGGVLGAFLVAPIMATLRVLLAYLWHKINLEDPFPGETAPFEWGDDPFVSGAIRPGQRARTDGDENVGESSFFVRQPAQQRTRRHSEKE